jgi:hypothetical protein
MPVTVRLSKKFYDRLGDEIANELVDWFNAVDATYRADLREYNELNLARFEARLDQRVAELEARINVRFGELDNRIGSLEATLERRLGEQDTRIGALEATLERRLGDLGDRIGALEATLERRLGQQDNRIGALEATLERRLGEHLRWQFVTWAALFVPIIGLWFR